MSFFRVYNQLPLNKYQNKQLMSVLVVPVVFGSAAKNATWPSSSSWSIPGTPWDPCFPWVFFILLPSCRLLTCRDLPCHCIDCVTRHKPNRKQQPKAEAQGLSRRSKQTLTKSEANFKQTLSK